MFRWSLSNQGWTASTLFNLYFLDEVRGMKIENILALISGLSLFMLGMNSMGNGLETACGSKMKMILKKLTSNRFVGVLVGALITAIIQSSSATTVMVVGFVNAGMMTLYQAIWIIMGANIGTTVTGLLIALDVGMIAPLFAIAGIVMMYFIKKPIVNEIGKIILGFGVLFIGMELMSWSMKPLRDLEAFTNLMTSFSNPIIGILVGMVFTAVIQSSSASVGILQALALSGAIGLENAVFVLFGMNIGTCVTALLASIGTNRNAKRTTLIHFMFNLIGTIIFTIICIATPLVDFMKEITSNPSLQIANMHTLFNIVTTILIIPFGLYLVKLAELILPDKKEEENSVFMYLKHDKNIRFGNASLHLENLKKEVERMYSIACESVNLGFEDLFKNETNNQIKISQQEDLIDKLNEGIIKHITYDLKEEVNENISKTYSAYLSISNNLERISDHVMNIAYELKDLENKDLQLCDKTLEEINLMKDVIFEMMNKAFDSNCLNVIKELENKIDKMTIEFKNNTFNRLKMSSCSAEVSIIYSTLLINFERIGDHLLNISEDIQNLSY